MPLTPAWEGSRAPVHVVRRDRGGRAGRGVFSAAEWLGFYPEKKDAGPHLTSQPNVSATWVATLKVTGDSEGPEHDGRDTQAWSPDRPNAGLCVSEAAAAGHVVGFPWRVTQRSAWGRREHTAEGRAWTHPVTVTVTARCRLPGVTGTEPASLIPGDGPVPPQRRTLARM